MNNLIQFACPNISCKKRLKAPQEHAGRQARCVCGQMILVPYSQPIQHEEHGNYTQSLNSASTQSSSQPSNPTRKAARQNVWGWRLTIIGLIGVLVLSSWLITSGFGSKGKEQANKNDQTLLANKTTTTDQGIQPSQKEKDKQPPSTNKDKQVNPASKVNPIPVTPPVEPVLPTPPERNWVGHSDLVWTIAISPDGKEIVSGSSDKTIKFWDPVTGKEIHTINDHKELISCLTYSKDGAILVSATDSEDDVRIWDSKTRKLVTTLKEIAGVRSIAFSYDGKTLACGGIQGVAIYDVKTWKKLRSIEANLILKNNNGGFSEGVISCVIGTPDNKHWITGSSDSTIRVWDATSGELKSTLVEKTVSFDVAVNTLSLTSDGKILVSAHRGGMIKMWDLENFKFREEIKGDNRSAFSVAHPKDPKVIFSVGADKTFRIWDISLKKEIATFKGHTSDVYGLAISTDGLWGCSGSRGGELRTWHLTK